MAETTYNPTLYTESLNQFLQVDSLWHDNIITPINSDSIITSWSVWYAQTTIWTLENNQDIQSWNFVTTISWWKIYGNWDVEFGSGFFRWDITGATWTFSWTISGWSLSIWTSPNWFNVDSSWNIWSWQDTLVNAQTNTFAVTNAWVLYAKAWSISWTLTVWWRLATTIGWAIDVDWHFADDAISTASATILGNFTFWSSWAIQIWTYSAWVTWDVKISPTGILWRDKDNNTTFSINATTGVAVLNGLVVGTNVGLGTAEDSSGVTTIIGNTVTTSFINALNVNAATVSASISITSPTIIGWSIAIGSSNNIFKADSNGIYLGNATFASAPFSVSMVGALKATSATISWTITIDNPSDIDQTDLTNSAASGATVGATLGAGGNITGGSTSANYINNSGYTTAITATSITTGTLTVGSSEVGIYVKSGGDIEFENTAYSSFSSINFTKKDVAGNQWEIYYTATGGAGYVEGNLVFEPLANGQRMTVGSFARTTVGVYTHLDVYGNVDISGGLECGDIVPSSNGSYDLGSSSYGWDKLYLGTAGRYLYDNSGTLYWNGSAVGGSGTVTSIATSGAITGGTITTSGTISHLTSAGYKHVPTGGSSQQFLKYSSSGTPVWAYLGATANATTIVPGSGTTDLGSSTYYWNTIYGGKLNLKALTSNPSNYGDIVHYVSGGVYAFRGKTGSSGGSYTGSFDLTAY